VTVSKKFRGHVLDVLVAASAAYGVVCLVDLPWPPPDARTSVHTSVIALVGAVLYVTWLRPRIAGAFWWTAYEVGSVHGLLVNRIRQVPHRRPLFDPVDEVVLVCRKRGRFKGMEVMRIRGDDYMAIAEGSQSFLMVETFFLMTWGSRLITRRVDPWSMTLNESLLPVSAHPVPAHDDEPRPRDDSIKAGTGLLFAASEDVRLLADQLARVVP
jgi:hypothetical protein